MEDNLAVQDKIAVTRPGPELSPNRVAYHDFQRMRWVLLVIALAAALAHAFRWGGFTADTSFLALFGIALLPWLLPVLKSFKIGSVLDITVDDLWRRTEEATATAEAAKQQALLAQAGGIPITLNQEPSINAAVQPAGLENLAPLTELAGEYAATRSRMKPGDERTLEMTRIFKKMAAAGDYSKSILLGLLADTDGGKRLVGFALCYNRPDYGLLRELIASASLPNNKPFEQYWSLRSISRTFAARPAGISIESDIVTALKTLAARIPRGTDRWYEMREILRATGIPLPLMETAHLQQ